MSPVLETNDCLETVYPTGFMFLSGIGRCSVDGGDSMKSANQGIRLFTIVSRMLTWPLLHWERCYRSWVGGDALCGTAIFFGHNTPKMWLSWGRSLPQWRC